MAPSIPRKKRKTTPHASHTKCKLHRDDDGLKKICNGLKENGSTCGLKVKRASRDDQLQNSFMPVCQTHKMQKFHIGYCEVTAACGERCNRPVPWKPSANQLCPEHAKTQLPSHLMGIPLELRMEIFDYVVPSLGGNNIHCSDERKFHDAYNLLQVSRQINAEVSGMMFGTQSRACEIKLDHNGYKMFQVQYHTSFVYSRPNVLNHISEASQHRPERINHLTLDIDCAKMLHSDRRLFRGLVNAWSLAKAIQPVQRFVQSSILSIKFQFGDVLGSAYHPKKTNQVFTVVKAFLHALSLAGLRTGLATVAISLVSSIQRRPGFRARNYLSGAKLQVRINGADVTLSGRHIDGHAKLQQDFQTEADLFIAWRQRTLSDVAGDEWTEGWSMLAKLAVVCRAIHRLSYQHSGGHFAHFFASEEEKKAYKKYPPPPAQRGITAYQTVHIMMGRAYAAFCHQEFAAIRLLLQQIQTMWQTCTLDTGGCIGENLSKILSASPTETIERNDLDQLYKSYRRQKLVWPALPQKFKIPSLHLGKDVDGVYKEFVVDGKKVLRLITPTAVVAEDDLTNSDDSAYSDFSDV